MNRNNLPYGDPRNVLHRISIGDGCHEWLGSVNHAGYGQFEMNKKRWIVHRWTYEYFVGPIPEGMDLDHLCRNRRCCRYDHLEPVTRKENLRRGVGHGSETHCPQGHPYDDENTAVYAGRRRCKTCNRERARRHYAESK